MGEKVELADIGGSQRRGMLFLPRITRMFWITRMVFRYSALLICGGVHKIIFSIRVILNIRVIRGKISWKSVGTGHSWGHRRHFPLLAHPAGTV